MKVSIFLRLLLGLGIAVFIFASALRASLEDILAPLPVAAITTATVPSKQTAEPVARRHTITESGPALKADLGASAIFSSDLQDSLTEALVNRLRPSGELSLLPLRDFPDLSSHAKPFVLNLTVAPSQLSRENILLGFRVENEEGVLGEWSIPFRVQLLGDVWYPRSRLNRGELATPSDFEIRQIDLLASPDAVPAVLESLIRHEYSRDVFPGRPLGWNDLMERSLVRKGDVVEVSAVSGLLAITMRAVARQDGADGDLILLRNIDSSKEFSARVIGENRVEVIF